MRLLQLFCCSHGRILFWMFDNCLGRMHNCNFMLLMPAMLMLQCGGFRGDNSVNGENSVEYTRKCEILLSQINQR